MSETVAYEQLDQSPEPAGTIGVRLPRRRVPTCVASATS